MTLATNLEASADFSDRHPWVLAFLANPDFEFERFMARRANLSNFSRAEIPDAAVQLFAGLPVDSAPIRQLELESIAWLDRARTWQLPEEIGPRRRMIGQLCDVFRLASRLELVGFGAWCFAHRVQLAHWLAAFCEGDDRDARLEFFHMLALLQPRLAADQVSALVPLWLDLCRNAGSTLRKSYLDTGLIGLRKAPPEQGQSDVSGWLAGLAHWALGQPVTEREFLSRWRALKYCYPRAPNQWRTEISRLWAQPKVRLAMENSDSDLRAWWCTDNDIAPLAKPNAKFANAVYLPTIDECEVIKTGLQTNLQQTLQNRVPAFVASHLRFARSTGIEDYLVISIDQIGRTMVKTHDPSAAKVAVNLAMIMLRWQPSRSHGWSLWADAVEVLGKKQSAEAIRREQLLRLPFHVDAYTQLAEFLIADQRLQEAEEVIEKAVTLGLENAVTRAVRIRLAVHLDSVEAARTLLQQSLTDYPDHVSWPAYKAALDAGKKLNACSHRYQEFPLIGTDESSDDDELIALFQQNARLTAAAMDDVLDRETIVAVLQSEPEHGYARLLAARCEGNSYQVAGLPGFAVQFERALREEDRDVLEQLGQEVPRLRALTLVAQCIFGDAVAAAEVEQWLSGHGNTGHDERLAVFRDWLNAQWHNAATTNQSNIVDFASFAEKKKAQLLLAVRSAHPIVFQPLLLAA